MRAAAKGFPESVELLIEEGADISERDCRGETPLMLVARSQYYVQSAMIRVLLKHGARLQDVNNQKQTALVIAASHGQPEIVPILIEAGADVNCKGANGETPLMRAASRHREERSEMIRTLLDRGAHVQDVNQQGMSALMMAATPGPTESIELLIAAGADINGKDGEGESPVMKALRYEDLEMHEEGGATSTSVLIKFLLEKGASVQDVDSRGQSPLMIAAKSGSFPRAELLIEAGADINQKDLNGETPMMMAASHSVPIIQLLLERGASTEQVDCNEQSALLKALIHYNHECSELIWAAATEANGNNEQAETLVVQMCEGLVWNPGHILEFLLEHNAVPVDVEQYSAICVLGDDCPELAMG